MSISTFDLIYGTPRTRSNYLYFAYEEMATINGKFYLSTPIFESCTEITTSNIFDLLLNQWHTEIDDTNLIRCQQDQAGEYTLLEKQLYFFSLLNSLRFSRQYLTDGYATSVSKIANFTGKIGFSEMIDKKIIEYVPDNLSQNKLYFITERTTLEKAYSNVKFFNRNEGRFIYKKNSDNTSTSKNAKYRENLLRSNAKAMQNHDSSYINDILGWYDKTSYALPLSTCDIAYTILSQYRTVDSSISTLLKAQKENTSDSKEQRRITKNLYTNLYKTFDTSLKPFNFTSETAEQIDTIIHNYELERFFHFNFLTLLIQVHRLLYNKIPKELLDKIDEVLILAASLPNAYGRDVLLLQLLAHYLCIGYNKENKAYTLCNKEKISQKNILLLQRALINIAYIIFPIFEKISFHTLYNHKRNQCQALEPITHVYNFFEKDFSENLSSYYNTAKSKDAFDRISPDTLTSSDLDFLYKFFTENYTHKAYQKRNNYILSNNYFGIRGLGDKTMDDNALDFIKQQQQTFFNFSTNHLIL